MTASTNSARPAPIIHALARFGRRALGALLLAIAIGLSTCQALHAVDPEFTAPVLDKLSAVGQGTNTATAPARHGGLY